MAIRAWRATNAATSAIETAPSASVWVEPQPCSETCEDRVDAEHQPAGQQHRAGDVGAGLQADPGRASTSRIASSAVAMPIGTLTKKIQCQLIASVSAPPASRPIEPPAEATNP